MLEMLRVDDRLIHGQIAISWSNYLQIDSIVVINDAAANDELQKTVLKMACPKEIKLAVLTVDKAIPLLNDVRLKDRKVLLIVNNLNDALELLKSVKDIKCFNIGNYGKNTGKFNNRRMYHEALMADDKDISVLEEILKTGVKSIVQLMPDRECIPLQKVIKQKP